MNAPTPRAGEVGLGGELRGVTQLDRRISEAAKLGFTRFIVPAGSGAKGAGAGRLAGVTVTECRTVGEAFRAVLGRKEKGA